MDLSLRWVIYTPIVMILHVLRRQPGFGKAVERVEFWAGLARSITPDHVPDRMSASKSLPPTHGSLEWTEGY